MKTRRTSGFRRGSMLMAAAFALTACAEGESRDAPEGEAVSDESAATQPAMIPTGTSLTFQVGEAVSTDSHEAGDQFTATLVSDIVADDGSIALPSGTPARWVVTQSTSDGADGQALLAFRLESIQVDGEWTPVDATVTSTEVETEAGDSKTESAAKVAVGAAAGAIIGQIIGKDSESTLTGAGVGAAVGTAVALTTRDGSAELRPGSTVTVRLDEAVSVES